MQGTKAGHAGRVLLTEAEVAERTGLARPTLRTWRSRRIGPPAIRLGSRIMYDLAELERWLDSRPRVGGAPA